MAVIFRRFSDQQLFAAGICLIYPVMALLALPAYFSGSLNMITGLILAPYISCADQGKRSLRYLAPALIMSLTALFLPVKTVLYLALLFNFLFLLESSVAKTGPLLLFLFLLISPVFAYISNTAGFPLRLWLSNIAAAVLKAGGINAQASGNIISIDQYEFAVDQACAGLNMLALSLMICLFVIACHQRKSGRRISFGLTTGLLLLTIVFNLICNLFRIVLLVFFKIMPEDIYHDIIGILCLLLYVILPLLLFSRLVFKKAPANADKPVRTISHFSYVKYPALQLLLFVAVLSVSINLKNMDNINPSIDDIQLRDYKKEVLKNGILKFDNTDGLIYLKPTAFYAPEHNPMICWEGSGYTFTTIKKEVQGGTEIYTAILEKGTDRIFSAWWFDNGVIHTTNQLTWRWKAALDGDVFYLVNVNAEDPHTLKKIIKNLSEPGSLAIQKKHSLD